MQAVIYGIFPLVAISIILFVIHLHLCEVKRTRFTIITDQLNRRDWFESTNLLQLTSEFRDLTNYSLVIISYDDSEFRILKDNGYINRSDVILGRIEFITIMYERHPKWFRDIVKFINLSPE